MSAFIENFTVINIFLIRLTLFTVKKGSSDVSRETSLLFLI